MRFGTSKSSSETRTPEQKKWLGTALGIYGPELGKGEDVYGGQRVAPFSETQKGALGSVQGFLDTFGAQRDMPLFGETGTALAGILAGRTGAEKITPEATQSYYQRAIEKPAMKRWSENIRPTIKESYAGPGYWSSARAKAEMEGAQDVGDWLGEQRGQLEWDVGTANRAIEEAKAGRALAGIQPAMAYGQLPTQEARQKVGALGDIYGFGTAEQQQRQTEINAAIQKFAEENRITSQEDMDILMALLNMNFGRAGSSAWNIGIT